MCNIDEIMTMLDWNNELEEQKKGIELAKSIKNINVFLQPLHPNTNKNVWDNCAKVLASKEDKVLLPYTTALLEWLQDLNWPGALVILERLKHYKASDSFVLFVTECINRAIACNEQIWLDNLSELLDNEALKAKLSDSTLVVLQKHYHNWEN